MTDIRAIGSSLALGAAVTGIEIATAAEWVAKPAVGGLVALVFFWLQRKLTRQQESEAAQEAEAKAFREQATKTLADLRARCDAIANECALDRSRAETPVAEAKQRLATLERDIAQLHERIESIHDTWNGRHADLMGGLHAAQTDLSLVRERLSGLESSHAANHRTPRA